MTIARRDDSAAPVIAIDGPGGSGKGTVGRLVAARLGWHFLDSGSLYRLTAFAAQQHGVALDDDVAVARLAARLDVVFRGDKPDAVEGIVLEGHDVTREVRSAACGSAASRIAACPAVRQALLDRQRSFRQQPGLVADGRDMGTVVFPDAPLKVFLTASAEERANRRYKQLKQKGINVNLSRLLQEIAERDERDQRRSIAPLSPAADAIVLDSTGMGIDEVVARVVNLWNGVAEGL